MDKEQIDETTKMTVSVYLDITMDIEMDIPKEYFDDMNNTERENFLQEQYKKYHQKILEKKLNDWSIEKREFYL